MLWFCPKTKLKLDVDLFPVPPLISHSLSLPPSFLFSLLCSMPIVSKPLENFAEHTCNWLIVLEPNWSKMWKEYLYFDTSDVTFLTSFVPHLSLFSPYPQPLSPLLLLPPESGSHSSSLRLKIAALSLQLLPSGRGPISPPFESGWALWISWKWYPTISKKASFSPSYNLEIIILWKSLVWLPRGWKATWRERCSCPRWPTCWSICMTVYRQDQQKRKPQNH